MDENPSLLPCPFCGDSQLGQMQMTSFDETPPRKWMRVKCDTCGAMAPDTAWNQRALHSVKRYEFHDVEYDDPAYMAERTDGEYVRYDDIKHLLTAHSAGEPR